jgi:hypothetical protein
MEHFANAFFRRVVRACFGGLDLYKHMRRFKKKAKERGIRGYVWFNSMMGGRKLWDRMLYRKREKAKMKSILHVWGRFHSKLGMQERFPMFTHLSIFAKLASARAKQHFNDWIFQHGFWDLIAGAVRLKAWHRLNKQAERHRDFKRRKRVLNGLLVWKTHGKDLGKYYYKRYLLRIARKVLFGLQLNAALQRDGYRKLVKFVKEQTQTEERFNYIIKAICKFQAIPRRNRAMAKYAEDKVNKLYSIQMLQNFFRVYIARKEYMKRYRKHIMKDAIKEDKELDLMRHAEAETLFYNYLISQIVNIQRYFRGYLGRERAYKAKVAHFQFKTKAFLDENEWMRLNHDNYLKQLAAFEHRRQFSATLIQKRVRGMQARKRFKEVRRLAQTARLAVIVQRQYRRRLGEQRLRALKRGTISKERFLAARRQRGFMLRLFGFKSRKTQSKLGGVLKGLGIDPVSFNYRLPELIQDTINDFQTFKVIIFHCLY